LLLLLFVFVLLLSLSLSSSSSLLLSQVLTGSVLGWLAAQTFPESSKAKAKEYYGWHPNNPAKSASALAATTGASS